MNKILVTGFEAFGTETLNPSRMLVEALRDSHIGVDTLILPVDFARAFESIQEKCPSYRDYHAVLMLGQAKGRSSVCLERMAVNWTQVPGTKEGESLGEVSRIIPNAPDAYIVDFFPEQWAQILSEVGLTTVSLSAGAFVCNNTYFKMIHSLRGSRTMALFVHVPLLPEQVRAGESMPSMPLETQKRIVLKLIDLIANYSRP